jgi:hypothetical protein
LVKEVRSCQQKVLLFSPLDFNLVRLKVLANTYSDCQVSTKNSHFSRKRKKEERKKKDGQKGDNSIQPITPNLLKVSNFFGQFVKFFLIVNYFLNETFGNMTAYR